jgi:hypothetical protein
MQNQLYTKLSKFEHDWNQNSLKMWTSLPRTQEIITRSTCWTFRDPAKARELWNSGARRWFPEGPDDPRLMILKVEIVQAEYWDVDKRAMIRLLDKGAGAEILSANDHKKFSFIYESLISRRGWPLFQKLFGPSRNAKPQVHAESCNQGRELSSPGLGIETGQCDLHIVEPRSFANLHSFVVCALQSTRIGLPGPENGSLFCSCEILRVHNLHRVRENAGGVEFFPRRRLRLGFLCRGSCSYKSALTHGCRLGSRVLNGR